MGRPKEPVPQDIADAVVEWVSAGKTLSAFCRQPGMPTRRTIDRWRADDEEFASRVARARDTGFDVIADECIAIADTTEEGTTTTEDDDGKKTVTGDMLGHRKLRVETRLKLLACWDPRRYGNKQQLEHSGAIDMGLAERIRKADERLKEQSPGG